MPPLATTTPSKGDMDMKIWTVTNYGNNLEYPYTDVFKNRGEALKHIETQWDIYVNDYRFITDKDIPTPELPEPTHTLIGYSFQFCIDPSVQDPEYSVLNSHSV